MTCCSLPSSRACWKRAASTTRWALPPLHLFLFPLPTPSQYHLGSSPHLSPSIHPTVAGQSSCWGGWFLGCHPPSTLCHRPQVTIWEALTNSKPGTHPLSHEGRRGDRLVRSGQPRWGERVWEPDPRGPH